MLRLQSSLFQIANLQEDLRHKLLLSLTASIFHHHIHRADDDARKSSEGGSEKPKTDATEETKQVAPNVPTQKEEDKGRIKDSFSVPWCDGKRIFVNKLGLYDAASVQPHFITFHDLLHPTLQKSTGSPDEKLVKALFTTFVYDQETILGLLKAKLPVCVIKDREGGYHGKLVKDSEYPNLMYVYPEKAPGLHYGVFHAKLILLQFTSFLRVVVTSANLTTVDWTLLSQVVWLQDFPKTSLSITETERQDFFATLHDFLVRCFPVNYELPINIYNYDYSGAVVDLVASVSGRFGKDHMHKYGCTRVGAIVQRSEPPFPSKPILTYQT